MYSEFEVPDMLPIKVNTLQGHNNILSLLNPLHYNNTWHIGDAQKNLSLLRKINVGYSDGNVP